MTTASPNRPRLVTALIVLHLLGAVACVAIAVFLLYLTRTSDLRNGEDAAETIHGLFIASAVMIAPALLTAAAALGMWRRARWGWTLALLLNVAAVLALVEEPLLEAGQATKRQGKFAMSSSSSMLRNKRNKFSQRSAPRNLVT